MVSGLGQSRDVPQTGTRVYPARASDEKDLCMPAAQVARARLLYVLQSKPDPRHLLTGVWVSEQSVPESRGASHWTHVSGPTPRVRDDPFVAAAETATPGLDHGAQVRETQGEGSGVGHTRHDGNDADAAADDDPSYVPKGDPFRIS